jgi:hypothetical protein
MCGRVCPRRTAQASALNPRPYRHAPRLRPTGQASRRRDRVHDTIDRVPGKKQERGKIRKSCPLLAHSLSTDGTFTVGVDSQKSMLRAEVDTVRFDTDQRID